MPAMPFYRGLDNELHHLPECGPATDGAIVVPEGIGHWLAQYDEEFTYFPDDSERALADGINYGRYDETGGEVGNQQTSEAVVGNLTVVDGEEW